MTDYKARTYDQLRHVLVYLAIPLAFLAAPVAHADVSLVFGTYAADKPTETVRKYKPFLNFLAREMAKVLDEPVNIDMKIAKEYDASIAQLANGEVQIARFGPASYVTVKDLNADIQIVAMEAKKGAKRFKGVIAVHQDSDLSTLSDLDAHSFAFGNELSTIGRYLAQSHLLDAGITSADLSEFAFFGRHDLVGFAVGSGKYAAGALKESTFKKLVKKGVPIRSLFEFDNVTKPWLAAADLDPRVLSAMRTVLLAPEHAEAIKKIAKTEFVDGSDADYDFIRQAMKHSQQF